MRDDQDGFPKERYDVMCVYTEHLARLPTVHCYELFIYTSLQYAHTVWIFSFYSAKLTRCDRPILSLQVTELANTVSPTNDDPRDAFGDAVPTDELSSPSPDDDWGKHLDLMMNRTSPVPPPSDLTAHTSDLNESLLYDDRKIVKDLNDAFGSSACFVSMTNNPVIDPLTHRLCVLHSRWR